MKKVIIIGAGIAGLTCGVYSRLNGFETEIYEMHSIPGGQCTGWDRQGYHFDGCLHWLVGSKTGPGFNEIWRETGALDDSVEIIQGESFARYEEDGIAVTLYTDADRLCRHLTEIAPEDEKEITKMCAAIKKMKKTLIPLARPMDMMTLSDGLKLAAANIGRLGIFKKYSKMNMETFLLPFKNPLLKRALLSIFRPEYSCLGLLSTLGGMNAGDNGFPAGGSRALALRMEAKYRAIGGKIFYRSKTDGILIEDGKAVGIRLSDGKEIRGDHVVSCADGYDTFYRMLSDKYTPDIYANLFSRPKDYPTFTSAMVFAGIAADIPFEQRCTVMRRSEPFMCGNTKNESSMIMHYGSDKTMPQPGKTVLASFYDADFDSWDELHKDKKKYAAKKKELERDAIAQMEKRFPQVKGNIEVLDTATPKTYERYLNAWRGSWMSWMTAGDDAPQYFPGVLHGLDNFIAAGMWTMPPGGLPGAAAAGRFAAQRICIQNGVEFKTK